MRVPYLPMLAFLFLFLLCFFPPSEIVMSVAPGWHVSMSTPYASFMIILSVILLLCTIVYGILGRRKRISFPVFFLHFLFSVPVLLWMRFGVFFIATGIFARVPNQQDFLDSLARLAIITGLLFIVAQVLFGIYAGKTLLKKRQ